MSVFLRTVNRRLLWVCPAAVMASWLAVRTLGASPELSPEIPLPATAGLPTAALPAPASPPPMEIRDAALAQMIGRFAAAARAVPKSDR